ILPIAASTKPPELARRDGLYGSSTPIPSTFRGRSPWCRTGNVPRRCPSCSADKKSTSYCDALSALPQRTLDLGPQPAGLVTGETAADVSTASGERRTDSRPGTENGSENGPEPAAQ